MRAVVQLTSQAAVKVENQLTGSIGKGLVVLLGVGKEDTIKDAKYLAEKIVNLRIFPDGEKLMNLSVKDVGGEILVVSQFTLFGDCRKGRRPGYSDAAPPEKAKELYKTFKDYLLKQGIPVESGKFQAMMEVELTNSGPVTLLLDSSKLF